MFVAEKGNGSYLNNQRIRVSSRSKLKDCIIFTGGPKNESKDRELSLKEYNNFSSKVLIPIRKLGSADRLIWLMLLQEDVMVFGKEI